GGAGGEGLLVRPAPDPDGDELRLLRRLRRVDGRRIRDRREAGGLVRDVAGDCQAGQYGGRGDDRSSEHEPSLPVLHRNPPFVPTDVVATYGGSSSTSHSVSALGSRQMQLSRISTDRSSASSTGASGSSCSTLRTPS